MMRAVYVCSDPGVPVWGNKGCSIHVQGLMRAMVRRGIAVDLIALSVGGIPPAGLEDVCVHTIECELPSERREREKALCDLNNDVIERLGTLLPLDFLYERYSLWSYAGVEFARHAGIPGLLEVNAPLVNEQQTHRTLFDRAAAVATTERAFRAASAVFAVSDEAAAHVESFGIAPDQLFVLPNAVDPDGFRLSCEHEPQGMHNPFTIGFVGSLKPWHGVNRLLSAYARLWEHGSGWRLVIVGDGPKREELQAQASQLPAHIASSIDFLGMVPHAEIPRLLATFNAAVAPWEPTCATYFSPLKLFEYMATGLPIVAAGFGQVSSIIRNEVNGLVYEPSDNAALTKALVRLRADPEWASQLGDRAHREVRAHHTWDKRCETVLRIARRSIGAPTPVAN
jgi:glycosyltransferase involved in cell wall biosynthesis